MNTLAIDTLKNGKRLSTQELLQRINEEIENGVTSFDIIASGQHDIGGPLWTKDGTPLYFHVKNPGQRVGCMGMFGTTIEVDGSVPADAGWLNSGAEIILKGDGGDTTAHCAASGHIYVGGRVGTRSGALMKFDPKFPAPEFWVLKNTGSFSFEFMGGGTAVVCGEGCENMPSVLGAQSCVGMVGGTVYVRGKTQELSSEVYVLTLNDADTAFLSDGLKRFLEKIGKPELLSKLSDFSQWKKIVAKTFEERKQTANRISIQDFRTTQWVRGGIFSDIYPDDFQVCALVNKGEHRLRKPVWENDAMKAPCETRCPIGISTQKRIALIRAGKIKEALESVLALTPFPACVCGNLCPNLCMDDCNRKFVDEPIKVAALGRLSKELKAPEFKTTRTQRVAVIGAGAGGLSAAWQLRRDGFAVDVFESDSDIGGKLRQVIPQERLDGDTLQTELNRVKQCGATFHTGKKITAADFDSLRADFDAVIVACGAHAPVVLPIEGAERLVKGLDFLKAVNRGEKPKIGEKVAVIGAGNAAMDVILGAYACGAKKVTAVDIQKPAAFAKEIAHAQSLGAEILYPCFSKKVAPEGLYLSDGRLIEADTVIISVGDRPVLDFVSKDFLDERGLMKINAYKQAEADGKVFVSGDAIKQGLFTHAVAGGLQAAKNVAAFLDGKPLDTFEKAPMLPADRVHAEYYDTLPHDCVQAAEPTEEKNRCLSCASCRDCEFCMNACPQQAIVKTKGDDGKSVYSVDESRCIGCGICAGVCPCGVWTMHDNM